MRENRALRIILLVILILYVVSPADLCPGPIDDVLAIAAYVLTSGSSETD